MRSVNLPSEHDAPNTSPAMTATPYGLEALRRYREQHAQNPRPKTAATVDPETDAAPHGLDADSDDAFDFDDLFEQWEDAHAAWYFAPDSIDPIDDDSEAVG